MSEVQTKVNATEVLPADLAAESGLRSLRERLQNGPLTAEALTREYLRRIEAIDPKLNSFAWCNPNALQTAQEIDRRRSAGDRLGPLAGMPIAIKQIFSVSTFPSSPATKLDVAAKISPEGPFVAALKRAGVIILGLTRTTEFAAATINTTTPAPWNPWDSATKRVCGGSSHGSAAAQAAGLCTFAVGSDTGGSVRFPAALCGVVGFKPTHGRWPTAGVFPLSPTFDTVGIFTNSVADVAFICECLDDWRIFAKPAPRQITFALPKQHSISLDPIVEVSFNSALEKLRGAGVNVIGLDLPEVAEVPTVFGRILGAELVRFLGREVVEANRGQLDPVVWARVEGELTTSESELNSLRLRHRELVEIVKAKIAGVDAVIGPTTPFIPTVARELTSPEAAIEWNRRSASHTRPGNLFGMCGIALPLPPLNGLPTSLQLLCRPGQDETLIGLAEMVETILGRPRKPEMINFCSN